jgi:hypothetical protein
MLAGFRGRRAADSEPYVIILRFWLASWGRPSMAGAERFGGRFGVVVLMVVAFGICYSGRADEREG